MKPARKRKINLPVKAIKFSHFGNKIKKTIITCHYYGDGYVNFRDSRDKWLGDIRLVDWIEILKQPKRIKVWSNTVKFKIITWKKIYAR